MADDSTLIGEASFIGETSFIGKASLRNAIASVPAGAWAVGVSGGADSAALLVNLADRADLRLHVVHLDHETRGGASAADASFVDSLAVKLRLPRTIARLGDMMPRLFSPPKNRSALFRAARFALFAKVIADHHLSGVLLGHHAGDQAETILHRLLRGSGTPGLGGIQEVSHIHGMLVRHPLLVVDPAMLRSDLLRRGISWREDASNQSPIYLRNRLRRIIERSVSLWEALLELGATSVQLGVWTDANAPRLGKSFASIELADLPEFLAARAARRWLRERGAATDDLTPATVARLIDMARDAASPPRQCFPGGLLVRRRKGVISVTPCSEPSL